MGTRTPPYGVPGFANGGPRPLHAAVEVEEPAPPWLRSLRRNAFVLTLLGALAGAGGAIWAMSASYSSKASRQDLEAQSAALRIETAAAVAPVAAGLAEQGQRVSEHDAQLRVLREGNKWRDDALQALTQRLGVSARVGPPPGGADGD